jgi:outer membrane murein-binding lipoprotein Lpp
MSSEQPPGLDALQRENAYLKARIAQLQSDVADVSAEVDRLRQERERLHGRREARAPNPLGSGQ